MGLLVRLFCCYCLTFLNVFSSFLLHSPLPLVLPLAFSIPLRIPQASPPSRRHSSPPIPPQSRIALPYIDRSSKNQNQRKRVLHRRISRPAVISALRTSALGICQTVPRFCAILASMSRRASVLVSVSDYHSLLLEILLNPTRL